MYFIIYYNRIQKMNKYFYKAYLIILKVLLIIINKNVIIDNVFVNNNLYITIKRKNIIIYIN